MKWLDKFIVSERGQWDHPGKPTAVPTKDGRITMQGVPYPVFAMDETGYGGMIYPGGNYQFPGKMVYEIPMAYGGDISIPDLSRPNWLDKAQKGQQVKYYDDLEEFKKANRAYQDSLDAYDYNNSSLKKLYSTGKSESGSDIDLNTKKYFSRKEAIQRDFDNYKALGLDISIKDVEDYYDSVDKNYNGKLNRSIGVYEFQKLNGSGKLKIAQYKRPTQIPKLDQQAVMRKIFKSYPGYSIKFENDKIFIREPETEAEIDSGVRKLWKPLPIEKKNIKPEIKKLAYKEDKLEMSDKGLAPITYMPPSNTAAILSKIKEEDMYRQAPKVVPAPTFKAGGWLDKYQDGSEVVQQGPELNQVNIVGEKPGILKQAWNNFKRSKYNPMNLFLEDMSSIPSEENAFDAARNMGMPEYMYKGKRYSTKMDWLTPQEQLEQTGITDDQLHRRGFFEKRLSDNLDPIGYGMGDQSQFDRFWNAAIKNEKDPNKAIRDLGIEDPDAGPVYSNNRTDAYNLYTGLPQKYNTFSISKYKPSRAKDSNVTYYSINDLANDKDWKRHVVDMYNSYKTNIDDIVKQRNLSDDKLDYLKKRYDIGSDRARINEGLNPGEGLNDQNLAYIFNRAFYGDSEVSRSDKQKLKSFFKDIGETDLANNIHGLIQDSRSQGSASPYSSQIADISNIISALTDYDPKTKSYGLTDYAAGVMGNYNLSKGVDPETGREYLSYRDIWDIDPVDFGKPFEIYDRIYFDDPDLIVPKQKHGGSHNWLNKYQDGSQVKTYVSDPNYFNNRAVFVDNPQANELVRSKVYAGTHGWDPSSNSLVKLDKPVAVPEAIREMSTADWGKKSSKERFESDTPAGKATRKAVAAREMEQAVTNPYFRGAIPAMLAAPAIAATGPSVLSALNTPAVIGSTTLPAVTAGNIMGAGFAADALVNRLPQIPGQLSRGEYLDAAINAGTGALDLYGANMVSPLFKGAKASKAATSTKTGYSLRDIKNATSGLGSTDDEAIAAIEAIRSRKLSSWKTPEGRRRLQKLIDENPYSFKVNHPLKNETPDTFIKRMENLINLNVDVKNIKEELPKLREQIMGYHKNMNEIDEAFSNNRISADDYFNMQADLDDKLQRLGSKHDELYLKTNSNYSAFLETDPYTQKAFINPELLASADLSPVAAHEVSGHSLSSFGKGSIPTYLDEQLGGLRLKNAKDETIDAVTRLKPKGESNLFYHANYPGSLGHNQDYWLSGSSGTERVPFVTEVKEDMLTKGIIKNDYDPITPEMLQKHYNTYMSKAGEKYPLRVYDIMEENPENFNLLSKVLNDLPSFAAPLTIAAGSAAAMKKEKYGGWLDEYQGAEKSSQVPANLPWINQQGQFTQVPPVQPKSFEKKVDEMLGSPQKKAWEKAGLVDNRRHSLASLNTQQELQKYLDPVSAAAAANVLGAAHEMANLPERIKNSESPSRVYHNIRETAEDMFNNAVGAGIGIFPFVPLEAKESFLMYLSDNNMMPDGVSLSHGDMYWKKKKGGVIPTDNQDYNYIKYKDLSLSRGTGWLDNYK